MARKTTRHDRRADPQSVSSQYVELFDFAPVSYAVLDESGIIVRISTAAARMLHAEFSELVGVPMLTLVVPEDRAEWLDHLRRCRDGSSVVESEIRFVPKQATRVTCRIHSRRTWQDGQLLFPTLLETQAPYRALDDARLAAERLRERAEREAAIAIAASEGKDKLLSAVSHELRTPLTPALVAASQLARWNDLPEAARHLASTIKRNIELQARLIDDLLDVARIREGRLELRLEVVETHQVLLEAIRVCGPFAEAKDITIGQRFTAESSLVRGDPSGLRQVFWNLLNNAIKFSSPGGSVVVTTLNMTHGTVTIQVKDYGAGMAGSALNQLFTAFQQTKPLESRIESRTGLGLGLAISKGIVDAHGGRISGNSPGPGRGSVFAIELATLRADQRASVPQLAAPAAEGADVEGQRPERVLLIEDDADSSEMLALSLSLHGFVVEVATSLADGLSKLDDEWDVVMSDIRLPDGSGLNIARRAAGCTRARPV